LANGQTFILRTVEVWTSTYWHGRSICLLSYTRVSTVAVIWAWYE